MTIAAVFADSTVANANPGKISRDATDSVRPRSVVSLPAAVPLFPHQTGYPQESVNSVAASAGPECKHPAKNGIGPAVLAIIVRYIAEPKFPKTKTTFGTERYFDQGDI